MYLFKKNENWKQKILDSLENKDGYEKVRYWRKCYEIHEWFCVNFEVENCEYVLIEKEELEELIEHIENIVFEDDYYKNDEEIKELKKVIAETDWDNEDIYYYAWW